jgi:hypothetical protein
VVLSDESEYKLIETYSIRDLNPYRGCKIQIAKASIPFKGEFCVHLVRKENFTGKTITIRKFSEFDILSISYKMNGGIIERRFMDIRIQEELNMETLGGKIWDASWHFSTFINDINNEKISTLTRRLESKCKVFEIASGCGLLAILLAKKYPNVELVLTEIPQVVERLQMNLRLNNVSNALIKEYMWGDPIDVKNIDLVVATDVIYNDAYHKDLKKTIGLLFEQNPGVVMIMAYKVRHDIIEDEFMNGLTCEELFNFENIRCVKLTDFEYIKI